MEGTFYFGHSTGINIPRLTPLDKVSKSLVLRIVFSLVAVVGLCFLILTTAKFGFSRLLQKYSLASNLPPTQAQDAVNFANSLTPGDPEAHRLRAMLLSRFQLFQYAKPEQELAVRLRSKDDRLWLELGNIHEELEEPESALLSYNEAVRYAPYYAHTHWQRGNLLLRMGQSSEAFADLRLAAQSNRVFVPSLIDLAWSLSRKDVKTTESLLQIHDDYTRIAFAKFLARNGEGAAALGQLNAVAGVIPIEVKRDMVRRLVGSKSYKAAFELAGTLAGESPPKGATIDDGGFESQITFDEGGIGWQIPSGQSGVALAQDSSVAESGNKSLRITFTGNSTPGVHLLSQTVLVSRLQRYQINLAFRVHDLVTGGPPVLSVSDACTEEVLGQVVFPAQSADEWHSVSLEFLTKQDCDAVVLNLSRVSCATSPCPIFGVLWLDSASIQELGNR